MEPRLAHRLAKEASATSKRTREATMMAGLLARVAETAKIQCTNASRKTSITGHDTSLENSKKRSGEL